MRVIKLLPILMLALGCGGASNATVKGSLALDGKPFALPPGAGEVFMVFKYVNDDGTFDQFKMYTAMVMPDGTFEVVASGGELPPGNYQVAIDSTPGKVPQFPPFALPGSKARIEFKPGANAVVIDLAKPGG